MKSPYAVLGILFWLAFTACEKKEIPYRAKRALAQLAEYNKQLTELDEKIKTAGFDPGLKHELVESKELLKSRIERTRFKLAEMGVPIETGEGGGEGGEHGGGGGEHGGGGGGGEHGGGGGHH